MKMNLKKVQDSPKLLKMIKIINLVLLSLTIITLIVSFVVNNNRLSTKESLEKSRGQTNKDAYQVTRFIAGIGTGLGVGARVLGILANVQEHFTNSLIYGATLFVLFLCYIIGFLKMSAFDAILHVILIILAFIYAKLVIREEPYSKDVSTLPL